MTRGRRARRWLLAAATGLLAVAVPGAPAAATPGPPTAPEYWFDSWRVPSLFADGVRGQGVTIAEIDTGVAKIPELAGRVLNGTDFGSAGGNGRVDREIDGFGHGTAMASIMVARPGLLGITGLAPGAKILPIAVPLNGTTDAGEDDHLPDAIRYAADHGAKIINMSLGGTRTIGIDNSACSSDEQSAVYHALDKGAIVVASIGNTGPTRNAIEDPAVCLGVVSVGAVDAAGQVASFSTRQPYLTLVAPGVGVPSLGRIAGQAYSGDGTSQATALTSASLALVWSKYPHDTGEQIVARVLATLDARRTSPSPAYGYGLLDTYRAVTAQVSLDAPNPVYTAAAPFLGRAQQLAAAARSLRVPAAVHGNGGTGGYSVGSTPRLSDPQVVTGVLLGGAGLVLLIVLGAGTVILRRRRAGTPLPGTGPGPLAPPVPGRYPPPGGPGPAWPTSAWPSSAWQTQPPTPLPGMPSGQGPAEPPSAGSASAGSAPADPAPADPAWGPSIRFHPPTPPPVVQPQPADRPRPSPRPRPTDPDA